MARAGFWHSRRDAQVIPLYFRVIGRPEREDSTGLLHELTSQRMTNKLRLDLPGTLDDDVGCRRFSLVHHHIASIPAGVVLRVSLRSEERRVGKESRFRWMGKEIERKRG